MSAAIDFCDAGQCNTYIVDNQRCHDRAGFSCPGVMPINWYTLKATTRSNIEEAESESFDEKET